MVRRGAPLLAGAILLAGCFPVAPPPPLGSVPVLTAYAGSECLKVLVIGDSIAAFVGERMEAPLEDSGRCVDEEMAAEAGAGVVDYAPDGRFDPASEVASFQPDVVFAFFVGNESFSGLTWTDPMWHDKTTEAALEIVDALPPDVSLYWGLPAKVAWRCEWGSLNDQRWVAWHAWIRSSLAALRPTVHVVDWRTVFGGDTYHGSMTFPDGTTQDIHLPDCVHFTYVGAEVAATIAAAAMQHEWVPAGSTTTTSTSTSTTTSSTSTSSTTSTSTTSTTAPGAGGE
jgi:hypothetical protein